MCTDFFLVLFNRFVIILVLLNTNFDKISDCLRNKYIHDSLLNILVYIARILFNNDAYQI